MYTVAMARTNDPHSATAQFFINIKNNDFLNFTSPNGNGWGYCVFGKVVEGTDVVDKIKAVKTGTSGFHQDVPAQDVVIQKAEVL
jgi:peptidyl-prolyl cis-trans isomerase B (cyclophilin B)